MTWKQFWGICEHHWERIDKVMSRPRAHIEDDWSTYSYHLQCKKCGNIKIVKV